MRLPCRRDEILCSWPADGSAQPEGPCTTRVADHMSSGQAQPLVRVSERGAATRSGLLCAAREVFLAQGYAQAGVTDIVALAGASVGSLYHHFSGKAELYVKLYEELDNENIQRTRLAVRRAREAGGRDPMQLFLAGARGHVGWGGAGRDRAGLWVGGDGPAGFEVAWRGRLSDWVSKNPEFFARTGEPL